MKTKTKIRNVRFLTRLKDDAIGDLIDLQIEFEVHDKAEALKLVQRAKRNLESIEIRLL